MMRLAHRIMSALALVALCAVAAPAQAATLPPAPTPAESFDTGMLHVDRYGSGSQTLILIPGLGSGPWSWYGTIAHFSPSYTIYALTLAGFDGRPATSEKPLFQAFSDDFWQMLSARNIVSPVVIGHSLGGTLAILLAEQHSDRLRAVVAVDGMPIFPLLANKPADQRVAIAAQASGMYAALTPASALSYETNYMQEIGTLNPDLVAPTSQLLARSDPKAVAAWLQADLVADLRPDLSKITIPLLEIMPYDPVMDAKAGFTQAQAVALYQSLLNGAPHATVVPIGPSRHFVMLDRPDAFYAAVHQFLNGLIGSAENAAAPRGL